MYYEGDKFEGRYCAGHVVHVTENGNAYRVLGGNHKESTLEGLNVDGRIILQFILK